MFPYHLIVPSCLFVASLPCLFWVLVSSYVSYTPKGHKHPTPWNQSPEETWGLVFSRGRFSCVSLQSNYHWLLIGLGPPVLPPLWSLHWVIFLKCISKHITLKFEILQWLPIAPTSSPNSSAGPLGLSFATVPASILTIHSSHSNEIYWSTLLKNISCT